MESSKTEVACLFVSRRGSKQTRVNADNICLFPCHRVTKNCQETFNLLTFDPDGDRVRCRVATNRARYECGLCGLLGDFTLNQVKKKKNFSVTNVIRSSWTKAQISQVLKVLSAMWRHYCGISKRNRANRPPNPPLQQIETQLVQNTPSALWSVGTLWCGSGSGLDHSVSRSLYRQWVAYIARSFVLCPNQNHWYNFWCSTWTDEL